MARITMVGGGVVGLCAGMMLARDGHDVTVLERDPTPPPDPDEAWQEWERRGVGQFRLLHFFAPGFHEAMDANLPDVIDALSGAGGLRLNVVELMPPEMSGGFQPGDERFTTVTARRPVAEAAIARVAAGTDNLTIRRGTAVAGLVTDGESAPGVPHVVGVRTDDGEELRADLVVDQAGRRSVLPKWLDDAGARPLAEELEDCGFIYYGRHFRSADGSTPPILGGLLTPYGTISTLTLPADNGTWGVGLIASSRDKAMHALKDPDVWSRVMKGFPLAAHWADGEPLDDRILVMARLPDRHRSLVVDGAAVATGVVTLADSWACTNPSLGRGISIGAKHAVALRDTLRDASDEPVAFAQQFHEATLASAEPWYRATLDFDRARIAEIDALLAGEEFEAPETWQMTQAMQSAAGKDPEVLRAMLRIIGVLDPPETVLAQPGVFEKVLELGASWRDEEGAPGLARDELLATVGA